MFGGVSYISYKYHEIKKFEQEFTKNFDQKRPFLFQIHQGMALSYENMMENYEKLSKIPQYRKILCSYAKGFVLETGIGSSRNLLFYPYGIKVKNLEGAKPLNIYNLISIFKGRTLSEAIECSNKNQQTNGGNEFRLEHKIF